jgi:two-component system, chemotaxis family, chemotaxis protein CheY
MSIDHSVPILVVEGFSTMSRIICGLLKKASFENVDTVQDGPAALAKMRETNYRLVISDWNMVPMTGHDLLNAIRSDEALAKTPFIMTTAEMSMNNVIAAKRGSRRLHHQAVQRRGDEGQDRRGVCWEVPLRRRIMIPPSSLPEVGH